MALAFGRSRVTTRMGPLMSTLTGARALTACSFPIRAVVIDDMCIGRASTPLCLPSRSPSAVRSDRQNDPSDHLTLVELGEGRTVIVEWACFLNDRLDEPFAVQCHQLVPRGAAD